MSSSSRRARSVSTAAPARSASRRARPVPWTSPAYSTQHAASRTGRSRRNRFPSPTARRSATRSTGATSARTSVPGTAGSSAAGPARSLDLKPSRTCRWWTGWRQATRTFAAATSGCSFRATTRVTCAATRWSSSVTRAAIRGSRSPMPRETIRFSASMRNGRSHSSGSAGERRARPAAGHRALGGLGAARERAVRNLPGGARERLSGRLRGRGLGLAFDFAVVSTFALVFSFQAESPVRQVMYLPLVEAALRYGIPGALALAAASAPVISVFEWLRERRLAPMSYHAEYVSLQVGLEELMGVAVGWLVHRLLGQTGVAETRA